MKEGKKRERGKKGGGHAVKSYLKQRYHHSFSIPGSAILYLDPVNSSYSFVPSFAMPKRVSNIP